MALSLFSFLHAVSTSKKRPAIKKAAHHLPPTPTTHTHTEQRFSSLLTFHLISTSSVLVWYIIRGPSSPVRMTREYDSHLSPHSSTYISVTGRWDCRPIPGSRPSNMGCNCGAWSTWELLHPPNELSPSLIWNYMRVNCNRLTGLARLLSKDNPLQIADYLPKIIIRNTRVDYSAKVI